MEYHPAIKKNEILKLASKWMELGKKEKHPELGNSNSP